MGRNVHILLLLNAVGIVNAIMSLKPRLGNNEPSPRFLVVLEIKNISGEGYGESFINHSADCEARTDERLDEARFIKQKTKSQQSSKGSSTRPLQGRALCLGMASLATVVTLHRTRTRAIAKGRSRRTSRGKGPERVQLDLLLAALLC